MRETARVNVTYADTDAMGVAYYGHYLRWFEIGRTELIRQVGLPYRNLVARDIHLPVVEAYCRYHRSARYDDELSIKAEVEEVGRASLRIGYQIWIGDNLAATGYTVHAFTDGSGKVIRPPREILDILTGLTA